MPPKPDLQLSIGADTKPAEQNVERFDAKFDQLVADLKKPLGDISAFVQMKKNLVATEVELDKTQQECNRLAAAMQKVDKPSKELARSFETAKAQAKALRESVSEQQISLQGLRNTLSAAGVNTASLASEQVRLKRALQEAGRAAEEQAKAQAKAAQEVVEAQRRIVEARVRTEAAARAEAEAQKKAADAHKQIQTAYRDLGVRPFSSIQAEIQRLQNSYKILANSGTASMAELAKAEKNLTERTKQLQAQMSAPVAVGAKSKGIFDSATESATRFATGLVGIGTAAGAIYTAKAAVSELIDVHMQMEARAKAFQAITGGYGTAASEMEFVQREANRLGLELLSTADSYKSFMAAAMGSRLEGEKTREIFSAVAETGRVLGLTNDQVSGAFMALGQMISKGKVQAEELRGQLGERLPGAFQIAARSMKMTTAELDKFMADGKLIADDFLPKFASELHRTFGKEIPNATASTQAALNRLNNAWTNLKNSMADGTFGTSVNSAVRGLTTLIEKLNEAENAAHIANRNAILNQASSGPMDLLAKHARAAKASIVSLDKAGSESFAGIGGGLEGPMRRIIKDFDEEKHRIQDSTEAGKAYADVLKEIAKSLDSSRTPLETFSGELQKYQTWLKQGMVTQDQFNRLAANPAKSFASLLADVSDAKSIDTIILRLQSLRQTGIQVGEAIDKEVVSAFQRLDALRLAGIQSELERFRQSGENVSWMLRDILDANLAKIGVDTEKFRSGMAAAENEAVQAFRNIASNSEVSGEQISQAFHAMVPKLETVQGVNAIEQAIIELGQKGKIGPTEVAEAMERLRVKTDEARAAAEKLKQENSALGDAFKTLGLQSSAALKSTAEEAKTAFKEIEEGYKKGEVAQGTFQAAFKAYAEEQLAYAKSLGGYRQAEIESTVKATAEVIGLGKEYEKVGESGREAGGRVADGMNQAAAATDKAKASSDALNSSLRSQPRGQASASSSPGGKSFDTHLAFTTDKVQWGKPAEGQPETGTWAASGTMNLFQVPHWDVLNDEMKAYAKKVITLADVPPILRTNKALVDTFKQAEKGFYRNVESNVEALANLRQSMKGQEMTASLASTIKTALVAIGKVLKPEAYSDLLNEAEDFLLKQSSERKKQALADIDKKSTKPEGGSKAQESKIQQSEQVTIQQQAAAEVKIETPEPPKIQTETGKEAKLPERDIQPLVKPEVEQKQPLPQPPQEQRPDDRPLKTLEQIASTMQEINRNVSTIAGIASRGSAASASQVSSKDLTAGMLSAISDAAMRS